MNTNGESVVSDHLRASQRGYKAKSPRLASVLAFLMVFGPGLIVMEADNDVNGIRDRRVHGHTSGSCFALLEGMATINIF